MVRLPEYGSNIRKDWSAPTPPPDRLPRFQHLFQCLTHLERLCPQQNAHAHRGGHPGDRSGGHVHFASRRPCFRISTCIEVIPKFLVRSPPLLRLLYTELSGCLCSPPRRRPGRTSLATQNAHAHRSGPPRGTSAVGMYILLGDGRAD